MTARRPVAPVESRGWDEETLGFLRAGSDVSAQTEAPGLLERAGFGQRSATGRHPIEVLTQQSRCSDVAVRTHFPVRVGMGVVLVSRAEADRVMREIAAQAWPDDPSPLEEEGYVTGVTWQEDLRTLHGGS